MGQVAHLYLAVGSRKPMREVETVLAIADRGFEGCRHARPGSSRQVLLMDVETLESFGLVPGEIKENVTTRELPLREFRKGQRLEMGEAVLEVTGPCDPCSCMDDIRMGLQEELLGQRGILCRVMEGGRIHRGDKIQVATAAALPETGEKL